MLTLDEFDAMTVGDLVEAEPIFSKLCREPVVLKTTVKTRNQLDFVATYFGVALGKWVCEKHMGGLKWTFT